MNYESIINKIQANNGWISSIIDGKQINFIHDDVDKYVEDGVHDIIVILNKKYNSITTLIVNFWRPFY